MFARTTAAVALCAAFVGLAAAQQSDSDTTRLAGHDPKVETAPGLAGVRGLPRL